LCKAAAWRPFSGRRSSIPIRRGNGRPGCASRAAALP